MLEKVGPVDWAQLSHSHGPAVDVPLHLAALAGPSEAGREEALEYFWGYLLHQGSRYEATPYAVRFLFEILEAPGCPVQRELIDLLLAIAVGYGESFLPCGYDVEEEETRFEEEAWGGLFSYEEARTSYYEVHQRAELFTRFVHPEFDPEVRLSAGFAVAHFAQPLTLFRQEVARYVRAETDPAQLQNLILCFGVLGRFADERPDIELLIPYLDPTCTRTMRVTASIALTTMLGPYTPDPALSTLLTALSESWDLTSPREEWQWWNEGDLLGYAALALRLVGSDRRDEIARVLCNALTSVDASTFAIPQTLLDVLFPEPAPANGWSVSDFDAVQRASLKALLQTDHWRTWMIDSRFLPPGLTGTAYRSALRRFIQEISGGGPSSDADLFQRSGNVSSWDLKKHWP